METDVQEPVEASTSVPGTRRRRSRTGKKRTKFAPPEKFPRGVRELWTSASMEAQSQAHRSCTQILSMWLGKRRREEVAQELSIPPLRVWQLSQQALAGMLAGLLHQPKSRRGRAEEAMDTKAESLSSHKKRIAELEAELSNYKGLLKLLTELPRPSDASTPSMSSVPGTPTPQPKMRARRVVRAPEANSGSVPEHAPAAAR